MGKRVLSLLLSFALLLGCFPAVAYAAAEDGLCEHHNIHSGCGYEEGIQDCDYHCEVCEGDATDFETDSDNHTLVNDVCSGCGAVKISETTFPDANFRACITSQSYGEDGWLTADELNGVTSISVSESDIKDLTGIGYFTALEELECYKNQLAELDVSGCTALKVLRCYSNQLTELDVSNCTALQTLNCHHNKLTELDVSACTMLQFLNCSSNQLTELDVSSCTVLKDLYCNTNQLKVLDVSGCSALGYLDCSHNHLTELDASGCAALMVLDCHENQLTELNASECSALTYLDCSYNQLTALDMSNYAVLEYLDCTYNQLTSLDASGCAALQELYCSANQLTALDMSDCTALTDLDCHANQLTCLDVSSCTALQSLNCYSNNRTVPTEKNQFDLSNLVADGFDISKASNWLGGTVSGNILTATAETVTYTYDLGNGYKEGFTLTIDGVCEHDWIDATCTAPETCSLCGATKGDPIHHTYDQKVVGKKYLNAEATCAAAASYYYSCTCGAKGTETFANGDALGHRWDEGMITKEHTNKAKAVRTYTCSNCGGTKTETVSIKAPAVPTVKNTASGIKVTWGKVSGAASYRIYYKTGSSWKQLATTKKTEYTFTKAKSGTKYYFTVQCLDEDGNAISSYNTSGTGIMFYSRPTISAVTNVENGVKVTWGKVSGAAKYQVYVKAGSGEWKKVATTSKTSYTYTGVKSGTKYYFSIVAASDSQKTVSSRDTSGKGIMFYSQPTISAVTNAENGVKVTWGKVSGAAKYQVYVKAGSGKWKKVATTSKTSYTYTGVKSGTKYYFSIVAASDSQKTVSSRDTSGKGIMFYAQPTIKELTNTSKGIEVTWGKVSGAGKYQVYVKVGNGEWKKVATTSKTSYTYTEVKSGTKYYFSIVAASSSQKTVSYRDTSGKSIVYKRK